VSTAMTVFIAVLLGFKSGGRNDTDSRSRALLWLKKK